MMTYQALPDQERRREVIGPVYMACYVGCASLVKDFEVAAREFPFLL